MLSDPLREFVSMEDCYTPI